MKSRLQQKVLLLKNVDIIFILLLITAASFPLVKINAQIIFVLISLQSFFILKKKNIKIETTFYFWLLLMLFFLNIFGLVTSERLSKGLTIVSRQSVMILFPLFYSTYSLKKISTIFKVYVLAIMCFIIVFETHTLYRFFYQSNIFPLDVNLFFSYRYTGAELTKFVGIHNAYLGMYIIFSNVLIISFIQKAKNNYKIIVFILLLLFQSLFIFQMVAKTAILLNICITVPLLIYILLIKKKTKTILFLIVILIISSWFVSTKLKISINRIQDRIEEISFKNKSTIRITRPEIWKTALPIIKDHFIFGVGTGDANQELEKQFKKKGEVFKSNIHNQFLDYLLRFGIIGLTLFVATLLFALYHSIKTNNYIYLCFTIIIIICSSTENILSRQWGVIFFGYFNYLLFLNSSKKE